MISQGEIRRFITTGAEITVVVLSSDRFNEAHPPLIAPLMQRGAPDLPPVFITLHDADRIKGVVDLRRVGSSAAGQLGDQVITTVIGETMARLRKGVNDLIRDPD